MIQRRLTLKEVPRSERPRERLLRQGPEALSDAELLAILLQTGTAGETAVGLAQRLLREGEREAGCALTFLAGADAGAIARLKGIGSAKAAQIKAAVELGRRLAAAPGRRQAILSPGDVARLVMEEMRHLEREQFRVLLLSTRRHLLASEVVSSGTLTETAVHPREVFRLAIRRSAHAVILVHNHPSGDATPSPDDLDLTCRLRQAGQMIGMEVLDHVIIGRGEYVSMKERNPALFT